MKDPADKKTMDFGYAILGGNRPEDKSGAKGLPPTPMQVMTKVMEEIRKAKKQRAPRMPLEILVARLRRYEQRMVAIALECEDFVHSNGENGNVARIRGIVNGEFDT